ncbi:hypothetical protein, partial [Streptomyces mirabilis]|uniref:hypothetical protein n=1 Tax=Streptomyces mirabilis TaxID=68239 RepID=UPI0037F34739
MGVKSVPCCSRHRGAGCNKQTPTAQEAAFRRGGCSLEVISIGEPAVTDEGAGDAREGEEVLGFALV